MTRVWLPYESVEAAEAAVGAHEGIEIDVYASADAPVPEQTEDVVMIALPNQGGMGTWKKIDGSSLPGLRLVQLGSAGFDTMVPLIPEGVSLANAGGVHDTGTAEMAVALALANGRGLDQYARDQAAHVWNPFQGRSIADRHVLIFGYGRIGAAVERRLAPFEPASVTRVARTAKTDPEVHATTELSSLLPEADLVVITAPASPETEGAFNAETLALLPDGALVVNAGRGSIIDTDAMIAEAGRLRFALDVMDPEPLPADHPLWDAPGVTIAPHVGGHATSFQPRYDKLIAEQLRRLSAGEPFTNIVAGPGA